MNKVKHIGASLIAFLVLASIVLPSVLKVSHALTDHPTEKCLNVDSLHMHEAELDCDFLKFKLTHNGYFQFISYENFTKAVLTKITANSYEFLSNYQKLHFALRAPPRLS